MAVASGVAESVRAQGVTLSPDTIVLGDQAVFSLPLDGLAERPPARMGIGLEVVGQEIDSNSRTIRTTITSFEPGIHYIHIGDNDSLPVVVTDVDVDTTSTEIRDIAPIEKVPYTFWEVFRWILLALIVAAVAFVVWWVLTHRKKVEQILGIGEPVDTRTPIERALQSLEGLRQKQLWQAGKIKEYYTELTDVVRQFIEESVGIRATEMTSDETLSAVANGHYVADLSGLRHVLTTADLVKFAKSEPLPHEHDLTMAEAKGFVEALWEVVKPQDEENKEGEA